MNNTNNRRADSTLIYGLEVSTLADIRKENKEINRQRKFIMEGWMRAINGIKEFEV